MTHVTDRCETCGVTADQLANPWGALIVSWVKWGKQTFAWALCLPCFRKDLAVASREGQ
jgi:hypothetical protein